MDVQNQKESIARVKAVDGLRGLAALMVVLNHLIVVFYLLFIGGVKEVL